MSQRSYMVADRSSVDHEKIPKQPGIAVSYWNVGILLHFSVILFVMESWFYWTKLKNAYLDEAAFFMVFWLGCLLFAFTHIFLVIMDAWSRFQNYKRIKDNLYIHGFSPKIAAPYMGSKCQRTAFLVAAKELGMENEVISYYQRIGIRWYHFIPKFMIQDPLFLFRKSFVSRTFLEKYYKPRFNFRDQGVNYKIAE
ncbi:hypothetical protein [Pedobacter hartonius]|uniref:Uncharacterized protein n=1 Tax=Pedobacter hartonius TaxID=425514 RepID=A0A1H4DVZ7_9SPHI|nr:hypothetical protein [Pedobacter hartonius]SEA76372.1 hypothetical protein SAMN05443550_105111 [Pedobacter hartonius]